MTALAETQRWMHGALVFPRGADAAERLVATGRLDAAGGLAVYQRGYFLRIAACMREQFPALCHALGRGLFDDFVADYIREQRLRRCLADLLSAQHVHRQIADVAYRWGFSDPVYFAKAFKQRFGRTPSDAREAAATLKRRGGDDPWPGDRIYEQWITGLA